MLASTQDLVLPRVSPRKLLPIPTVARELGYPRGLNGLFARAAVRGFEAKEHVFTEGDPKSAIYQVLSGAVSLYKVLPDGRRQVTEFAFAGDIIGLEFGDQAGCNGQTTVPTRLSIVSAANLDSAVATDPRLAMDVHQAIAGHVDALRDHLVCVGRRSAAERLAVFLLALARRRSRLNASRTVELPMNRTDIADFLGLTIETVSRNLTKFKAFGYIDIDQGTHIRLKNMVALTAVAEGQFR